MESENFKTASEEAMIRVDRALVTAKADLVQCKWWEFKKRQQLYGAVFTLGLIVELLHGLCHKYDNRRGELN